jgi:lactoylglutathione lyase
MQSKYLIMKTTFLFIAVLLFQTMNLYAQSNQPLVEARINHVAIAVTDLDESAQFYENVIGLEAIPEPFGVGRHAWFDMGGGAELHVILAAEERTEHNKSNHLCFSVSDMDAFVEQITSHGVEFSDFAGNKGEFNERPDGVRQIYFTDPDGYWIEINDDM